MRTRKLGPFEVSALGLGCMSMSHGYGTPNDAESARALHRALDLGYTMLDTAALYGFGQNETLIGATLQGRRQQFVLASKGGMFKDAQGKRAIDGRPEALKRNCEDSLRRLQTDVIDLYYLHRVDQRVPVEESVGAMAELVREGKVRALGLSEVSADTLRKAHAVHPIAAVQSEYSLWTRNPEIKVLAACQDLGIAFVAFSPLARGFLTGMLRDLSAMPEKDIRRNMPRFQGENFQRNLSLLEEFGRITSEQRCTMAQLALAWLLSRGEHVIPIPGTKRAKYVEENAGASDVVLATDVLRRLEALINRDTVAGARYDQVTQQEIGTEEFPSRLERNGSMQTAIPYMQLRGGSSKGLYFKASDLPADPALRNRVLIAAMCGAGSDDKRQIDGLGGADPLTSKVAVVSVSQRAGADLDYEFVQVVVGSNATDGTQNCGNLLAGVVPFAIEAGLLRGSDGETRARVFMLNSESICEVVVQTPGGKMEYAGSAKIDGVPGTAAAVICNYADTAGSACGELFPTGNLVDVIDGVRVTCIDNGMPVVLLRASDLGRSGYETPAELNVDGELKARLERIRLAVGPQMKLGDVAGKVVPKMSLIAPPTAGGAVHSRTFIPHVCHAAIGVLGAVSVATACVIPGTVAEGVAVLPENGKVYSVEHPSGEFSVTLEIDYSGPRPEVRKAGLLRTARLLSRGEVFIPAGIWRKP